MHSKRYSIACGMSVLTALLVRTVFSQLEHGLKGSIPRVFSHTNPRQAQPVEFPSRCMDECLHFVPFSIHSGVMSQHTGHARRSCNTGARFSITDI